MKYVGLMILFLHWSLSDAQRFVLKGPVRPVVAAPGSDIILSCSLNTRESAVSMEVTWSRSDLNDRVVHHYKDQKDKTSEQDPSYIGRTSLLKDDLEYGNTSLLLKDVQLSDMGKYKCEVQDGGAYDYLTITVTVTDPRKYPVITVQGRDHSGFIQLQCETKGWKFEPELQWVDSGGRELTAGAPRLRNDPEGYNLRLPLTVFGNITYVTCQVKDHPSMKAQRDASVIGSNPVIAKLDSVGSGGTRLQCETNGWKSKPDLEWFTDKGTRLIEEEQNYTVVNGSYTVRHSITAHGSGNSIIICEVKQFPSMEDRFFISDSSLLNDGSNPSNSWKIATIIFIVFFTIVGL